MDDKEEPVCGNCGARGGFSPIVAHVTVYARSLPFGFYLLQPDFDQGQRFRLCSKCPAALTFLRKAMAAHPTTKEAADWTSATFVFEDGDVEPWRLSRKRADELAAKIAQA